MTRPVPPVECIAGEEASVAVIAPHPDDESLAAGLLIQTAVAAGASVTVIVLTDGENNPWAQRATELRVRITQRARSRWGARRREEARHALSLLGVPNANVHFLGLPDLGLTDRLLLDPVGAASELHTLFERVRPTIVVAPALRDTHPDHSAAHIMARTAVAACRSDSTVLSYTVHGRRDSASAERASDSGTMERKMTAVAAHTSQHVLSAHRMRRYATVAERFFLEPACVCGVAERSLKLPWKMSRLACAYAELLVVSSTRAWRIAVHGSHAPPVSDSPVCVRRGDGVLWLAVPDGAGARGPIYAKLVSRIPSPWIYDRWGWTLTDSGADSRVIGS